MYMECREYLISLLVQAGMKRPVHTNQKTMDNDNEPHKAAVIADTDEQKCNGQKVIYKDKAGKRYKRTKRFDRTITFIVTIGDHTYPKVESIFERFLRLVEQGIYIDGNYTEINLQPATWYDEDDRIIKSKALVVFKVQFIGGVYVDTNYIKVNADIKAIEPEGKET